MFWLFELVCDLLAMHQTWSHDDDDDDDDANGTGKDVAKLLLRDRTMQPMGLNIHLN